MAAAGGMKVVPLRLSPGDDLRQILEVWMRQREERAGCLISGIGSLSVAQLRFAGASEPTRIQGDLEIISLAGTLSTDAAHLHIAIADTNGSVIGGHLGAGSLVRTTAELVVGLLPDWQFRRELDPATGYAELQISPRDLGAPMIAPQQLNDRHRAGAHAQAPQQEAGQLLKVQGQGHGHGRDHVTTA
ncbi:MULTISPECIES: PPC domain-containing DNA-binding protein [Aphanothece]|uniref:PPC domain-containing DNA-binding protein n=1 Tax=Aphanothece TaxID=1121 RepID=UPI00398E96CF